jgi:N-acetylglucosaminyldiphosphoundecaprenol N-acetyl-beta-D-mannosaminyltransferase
VTTGTPAYRILDETKDESLHAYFGPFPEFRVLGVRVHGVQIPETISWMERAILARLNGKYLTATGMHGITEALHDRSFKNVLNEADLVVPDGMPLVWLARQENIHLKRRVYGPELMEAFCRETGSKYRHFFYGGAQGVPEHLAAVMSERYGIRIAGCWSPPFRPLNEAEEIKLKEMVVAASPDILWVGLSTPKQERWMHAHRDSLSVPLMMGVGAAFDFHTGRVKQAPSWMQESGLEWLFRLAQEPKRLWKRYLVNGGEFVWCVTMEWLGIRKYE